MKIKLLKLNQYLQASALHRHQNSSNCQPLFRCSDFVKNEVFNTFYEDYVEFKHHVNYTVKLVTPVTSLSNENNFEKIKIKSEEEIKKFRNENITLKENILTQPNLKSLKIYLAIRIEARQTLPSQIKPSKGMTLT